MQLRRDVVGTTKYAAYDIIFTRIREERLRYPLSEMAAAVEFAEQARNAAHGTHRWEKYMMRRDLESSDYHPRPAVFTPAPGTVGLREVSHPAVQNAMPMEYTSKSILPSSHTTDAFWEQ